jgi:hypothetical protein
MKKKNNLGLSFKLRLSTGTTTRFIHSDGFEKNKQQKFQPHCNRERFSPTPLALAIATHATLNPKLWQEPSQPTTD